MNKIAILLISILFNLSIYGQDISGHWNGLLKVQGIQLRIVFNIDHAGRNYQATMDSPDQGAKGIPVTSTKYENSILKIELPNLSIEYQGKFNEEGDIIGNFKQGGISFPLNLSKEKIEKEKVNRPQEPKKPYPYYSEDIKFLNSIENIKLAGTLTLPQKEGSFPAVILISGSGPQNRDEELLGHKPFLVIADYLTKKGIAVLRFDDRGTAQSEGDFKTATSMDFAQDVEAALAYLETRKEINKKQIGFIGHSEGGIIAPMIAARNKNVSFIVLLAGTGILGADLLLMQQELIGRAYGLNDSILAKTKAINKAAFDLILKSESDENLKTILNDYISQTIKDDFTTIPKGMTKESFVSLQVKQLTSPWMLFFLKYNPVPALEKVKCPVLALNGSKDIQVPSKVNLEAIETALKNGKNKKYSIKELPNLNHLFQECETGAPSEYATIEQTFSSLALNEISNWILKQLK